MRGYFVGAAVVLAAGIGAWAEEGATTRPAGQREVRHFAFTYGATVKGLEPEQRARVWLPLATNDADQEVTCTEQPTGAVETVEKKYGNHLLYVEGTAGVEGTIPLEMKFEVVRHEDRGDRTQTVTQEEAAKFLAADARVPVGGKGMGLLAGKAVPGDRMAVAHLLYEVVDDHMVYRKDKPGWGNGDSDWACDSGYGNCTDFHSLFISLARAEKIPAKFEIGFLLPGEGKGSVAGYHCWAKFAGVGGEGWVPVDISEASQHPEKREANFGDIGADRVKFSEGRDLELEPRQAGGAVNFLVYPYVEVAGKVWPQEQIEKHFSYADDDGKRPQMDTNGHK